MISTKELVTINNCIVLYANLLQLIKEEIIQRAKKKKKKMRKAINLHMHLHML